MADDVQWFKEHLEKDEASETGSSRVSNLTGDTPLVDAVRA